MKLATETVDTIPIWTSFTDSNGKFLYAANPFNNRTINSLTNLNLLIQENGTTRVRYFWMPFYEAGAAYFNVSESIWYKRIICKD